jgi:hypothetical protein
MKNIYIVCLLASALLAASLVNAQREAGTAVTVKPIEVFNIRSYVAKQSADCDTINYPIPNNWTLTYYMVGSPAGDGYVAGTNEYDNKQKANYFDLSSSSFNYVQGAYFYFGVANSSVEADLSKNVLFKVYSDSAGSPGKQIGSTVEVSLSRIKADVDSGKMTRVIFPASIALPLSKKFYLSADISNFKWYDRDSITLVTTSDNEVNPGTAWEQESDNSWRNMDSSWGSLHIAIIILPFVSTTATGCGVLPVKLISFGGERKNNDVMLNWQTSDEYNMTGYEIEKAGNSNLFKSIVFAPARNDLKNDRYTFTDANAFTSSSIVQYRLKQIDNDGKATYSKIISIKDLSFAGNIVFANPFSNILQLRLNLESAEVVSINIYNVLGALVASEKPVLYNGFGNTITVSSTAALRNGVYLLRVTIGTKQFTYKIVKE